MPSELLSIEKERNQDAGKEAGRQGSADSLGRVRKDGVCVPSISVLQATVSGTVMPLNSPECLRIQETKVFWIRTQNTTFINMPASVFQLRSLSHSPLRMESGLETRKRVTASTRAVDRFLLRLNDGRM